MDVTLKHSDQRVELLHKNVRFNQTFLKNL